MKQSLLFALLLACKKDDADSAYFKCKIDGKAYEVEGLLAYAVNFSDDLTLYGVAEEGGSESCYLTVPKGVQAGTYTFNGNDYYGYYTDASGKSSSSRWGAGTGSVTIEEVDDKHIKGTFQFTAFDSDTESVKKSFTEGKFDVVFR
jgi:hypothetical protein